MGELRRVGLEDLILKRDLPASVRQQAFNLIDRCERMNNEGDRPLRDLEVSGVHVSRIGGDSTGAAREYRCEHEGEVFFVRVIGEGCVLMEDAPEL